MKKIIFGMLALFVVVGSASAVPSVDDRKALCEKTDGWVWVEKTQACIPENPCGADDWGIRSAYCADVRVPRQKTELVVEKYAEKVLRTTIVESTARPLFSPDGVGVETADGGYVAFAYDSYSLPIRGGDAAKIAFEAFGYQDNRENAEYDTKDYWYKEVQCSETKNRSICQEITDFASLLVNEKFEMEFYDDGNGPLVMTDCCIITEKIKTLGE